MNSIDGSMEAELLVLKRNHWRSWFIGPIPMLDNISPIQAAKTAEGKCKLKALLSMYDKFSGSSANTSNISFNPPSNWVRWKLKLTFEADGDVTYANEEEIFKGDDGAASMALYTEETEKDIESKLCNFCLKGDGTFQCATCRSRRYCSKVCQRADWKDHKKYCGRGIINCMRDDKKQDKSHWELTKCLVDMKCNSGCSITWNDLLQAAFRREIIDQSIFDADKTEHHSIIINEETKEQMDNLYLEMTLPADSFQAKLRQKSICAAFDGKLTPSAYMSFPLRRDQLDVSFHCAMINKRTGRKEFCVLAMLAEQFVYADAPIISHTKPPIYELIKAIHVSIMAPTGRQHSTDIPHRPYQIRIANRWGEEYFKAIRHSLIDTGILLYLQTREEAEAECAECGTDPDGYNML